MQCIYHEADFDGLCAAAIVLRKHPDCRLIPMDHGPSLEALSLEGDDKVYVVDFSLPAEWMAELTKRNRLIWIDHHHTAMQETEQHGLHPEGLRNDKRAACELTWEYCFPDTLMPHGVFLLGRYDVWDHQHPEVLPFQYGLRCYEQPYPNHPLWSRILNDERPFIEQTIQEGRIVVKYHRNRLYEYSKTCAFNTELEGLPAIAVNRWFADSYLFDPVYDPAAHKLMISFCYRTDHWAVALYTTHDDVNVGVLAQRFGGGGHRKAAGFACDHLPFPLS